LLLPSDVDWLPEEEPADKVPEWVDAKTGEPLSSGDNDKKWGKPRSVPTTRPRLHFHVEVKGDAPIRWRIPAIHDSRTRRSVDEVASSADDHGEGVFSMDLATWHQTALDVGIELANPRLRCYRFRGMPNCDSVTMP